MSIHPTLILTNNIHGARVAATLGILSSGLLSGALLALPTIAIPSILAAAHARDGTLLRKAWLRLRARAGGVCGAVGGAAIGAFLWAGAVLYYVGARGATGRTWAYLGAGVLSAGAGMGVGMGERAGERDGEGGSVGERERDGDVREIVTWSRESWARGAVAVVGFGLGVWATTTGEAAA